MTKETYPGLEEALKKKRENQEPDAKSKWGHDKYQERKEAGLCVYCGEVKLEEGRITCKECNKRINGYRKAPEETHPILTR